MWIYAVGMDLIWCYIRDGSCKAHLLYPISILCCIQLYCTYASSKAQLVISRIAMNVGCFASVWKWLTQPTRSRKLTVWRAFEDEWDAAPDSRLLGPQDEQISYVSARRRSLKGQTGQTHMSKPPSRSLTDTTVSESEDIKNITNDMASIIGGSYKPFKVKVFPVEYRDSRWGRYRDLWCLSHHAVGA